MMKSTAGIRTAILVGIGLIVVAPTVLCAAEPPKRNLQAVELVGQASDYWYARTWCSYFWGEDFTFLLKEEGSNKTWRIISRQPTPHYNWRMGPTYTGLPIDWQAKPRVKVVGVRAIDRIPEDFYYFRLDEPNLATAFIILVETQPNLWKEFFVNNWFHKWGDQADQAIHRSYADRPAPYDTYGFLDGMAAPLSKKSQAIRDEHPDARVFHGLIRTAKDNPFGYEVELLHLTGPGKVLYGDPDTIAVLDDKSVPRFKDVTGHSGIELVPKVGYEGCKPHAVGVEDFNHDGLPDVVVGTFDAPHVQYYRNLGKLRFQNVTKGSGLETFMGQSSGIAMGDFNRDGELDLFIGSLRPGESRLYQGTTGGSFVDVTQKSGALVKSAARSCAWSDIDGDGWLDLYVTSPNGTNCLFHNNGRGAFTDVATLAGVALEGKTSLGCAFGDVDGDALDDLMVTNYQSQVSALLKNLGKGRFRDVTAESRLSRKASSVGCVFADLFNQGRMDLYVTTDSWLSGANSTEGQLRRQGHTVEPNMLYANDGQGKFTPVTEPTFDYRSLSHDAILEDLDHDGLLDVYVGVDAESGNEWATSKGGNPLWTRTEGKWHEASHAWGIDHQANCVCIPVADFDNDGDLDLLLVNFYSNVVLYRNDTNDKHWLRVKAIGATSNPDGIGAQVSLFAGSGNQQRLIGFRHVQSGAGYARCSPLEVHFGLGSTPADSYRVEVFFPATKRRIVKENVKPAQRLVVHESGEE